MPDYGHDLQFGIFPSPDTEAAERTLELAQVAEVSGLDLVSIQDHPYQGRHLDFDEAHIWHIRDGMATEMWGVPKDPYTVDDFFVG